MMDWRGMSSSFHLKMRVERGMRTRKHSEKPWRIRGCQLEGRVPYFLLIQEEDPFLVK